MASSLNKVILIGYLGKDPDVRLAQDGSKIVTLVLATSEQWRDRMTEEQKERTEWHRIVIFNTRIGDIAERFTKKGQRVYIEGQLQSRKWVDTQNQEHRVQEIIIRYRGELMILDMPKRDSEDRSAIPAHSLHQGGSSHDSGASMDAMMPIDDEIPF